MLVKKNEVIAQTWWAITKGGGRYLKESLPSSKANDVAYLILERKQLYQDSQTNASYWIDCFQVHDPNGATCNLFENGVTGKVNGYDKFRRELNCFITDIEGTGRVVNFTGDISAVEKCIQYMQKVSTAPNWASFISEEQKHTIQRQKNEIKTLKQEVAELKSTIAAFHIGDADNR